MKAKLVRRRDAKTFHVPRLIIKCLNCQNRIELNKNYLKRKNQKIFCSRKCSDTYHSGKNNAMSKKSSRLKVRRSVRDFHIRHPGILAGKNNPRFGVQSAFLKRWHKTHVHPFKGHHHSLKTRKKISLKSVGKNNSSYGVVRYPKAFFVKALGHRVRSSYEEKVFREFKRNHIVYKYEAITFHLDNGTTYTPDAILFNNVVLEIKGPIFDWQITKMKLFRKKFPKYKFISITSNRYNNFKKMSFSDKVFSIDDEKSYISFFKGNVNV